MAKKSNKRKYTHRKPTPTQRIMILEGSNQEFQEKIIELSKELSYKEQQRSRLAESLESQWIEIAELRERNVTLVEAIEILARASRVDKQSKQMNRSAINQALITPAIPRLEDTQCEAGYAHGYEKRR